jgi:hypothetical protein
MKTVAILSQKGGTGKTTRIYEGNAASGDAQSNRTLADLKAGTPTPAATATIAVTYAKTEAEARQRGAMADAAQETKARQSPARRRGAATPRPVPVVTRVIAGAGWLGKTHPHSSSIHRRRSDRFPDALSDRSV